MQGDGFGEGVLYNPDRKRTANAFCDQESIVLALPLSVYVDVMNNVTDRMNLLSHCVMFRGWSEERRLAIANKMRPKQFDSNTTILRAGELVQELYIIKTCVPPSRLLRASQNPLTYLRCVYGLVQEQWHGTGVEASASGLAPAAEAAYSEWTGGDRRGSGPSLGGAEAREGPGGAGVLDHGGGQLVRPGRDGRDGPAGREKL